MGEPPREDGLLPSDSDDSDFAPDGGAAVKARKPAGPKKQQGGLVLEDEGEGEGESEEESEGEGEGEGNDGEENAGNGAEQKSGRDGDDDGASKEGNDGAAQPPVKKARIEAAKPLGDGDEISAAVAPESKVQSGAATPAVPLAAEAKDKIATSSAAAKPQSSVDSLWAEMNKPIKPPRSKGTSVPARRSAPKVDPLLAGVLGIAASGKGGGPGKPAKSKPVATADLGLASWLAGSAANKSQAEVGQFKMKSLEDVASAARAEEAEASAEASRKKGLKKTGLEGILGALKGQKQASVIERTRKAWDGVKEKDEEVANELEEYKKDKNRYTDRVAFLERTDRREFEVDLARKRGR